MGWKQRLGMSETEIDPFNAPDPIMPGGEPDLGLRDDGDLHDGDGLDRMARRNERHEPGRREHRPHLSHDTDDAQPADAYPAGGAPSPVKGAEEAGDHSPEFSSESAERRWRRARHREDVRRARAEYRSERKGAKKGRTGCLVLLIIFLLFGSWIGSFASCVFSTIEDAFDGDSSYDYSYDYEDDGYEDATYDSVTAYDAVAEEFSSSTAEHELDSLVGGDEYYVGLVAQNFSEDFESWTGASVEDAGIDADEVARWALAHTTYDIESTYVFGDQTSDGYTFESTVYFYLYAPRTSELAAGLSTFMSDEYDLWSGEVLTDGDREDIHAELERLMDEAEASENYMAFDFAVTMDADGENPQFEIVNQQEFDDRIASSIG